MSGWPYVVAAGVVVLAVGCAGAVVMGRDAGGDTPARAATPAATAKVTRGDVVDTESVDGRLAYAGVRTVAAGGTGTLTWLPTEGAVRKRGQALYRVDDDPVTLLYGALPLYRTLATGVPDGRDVRQLERNLKSLGYTGFTVDEHFSPATAAALKAWQDDLGRKRTGRVEPGQVVVQPGPVRIGTVKAALGDRAGGPVVTVTDTTPTVHVDLDAGLQSIAHAGDRVTVDLPDGGTVPGRITEVGTVATDGKDGPTVPVEIRLAGKAAGRVDQAPVTVDLESERARRVLSVPVEALLALREGGFGVQVVENGAVHVRAVEVGTFGGGRVAVTGGGLQAGDTVEVAAP